MIESDRDLVVTQDEPPEFIPFATWDPDKPAEQVTPFSHLSRPLRVELEPGDMLYLPALWYVLTWPGIDPRANQQSIGTTKYRRAAPRKAYVVLSTTGQCLL